MEVKEKCLEKILEFRAAERRSKRKSVRKFHKPEPHQLNYDATNLFDFFKWETITPANDQKHPPPNLRHLSDQELKDLLSENTVLRKSVRDKIPKELCHSQDCERNVQRITKAVLKTKGHDNQKSRIIVTQETTEQFPSKSSKSDVIQTLKK